MPEFKRWFLTIDWCDQDKRGIFCKQDGKTFPQDEPFDEERIREILGAFSLILNPQGVLLGEAELKEYTQWYPLAEFSGVYGYATKKGV